MHNLSSISEQEQKREREKDGEGGDFGCVGKYNWEVCIEFGYK